ncbi:MAG: Hsp20/alpha crystallin family protein [Bacteroidaceae bacterium]|nr:Hsp20/alpha crystallin family protein [Bacteroidaceae bacterium]
MIMLPNSYRNALNWMDEFFNAIPATSQVRTTSPAINITESEKDYRLELAVPGTTKEDYNIQLTEDGNLMVTLERKNENQEKEGRRYLRREFSYQHFSQAFTLPDDVDREKISASVKEGILYVDLPKKSAEAMSIGKKIEIQ